MVKDVNRIEMKPAAAQPMKDTWFASRQKSLKELYLPSVLASTHHRLQICQKYGVSPELASRRSTSKAVGSTDVRQLKERFGDAARRSLSFLLKPFCLFAH